MDLLVVGTSVLNGARTDTVARPVADWNDRTEDGVHPNDAGHASLAERAAGWLRNER